VLHPSIHFMNSEDWKMMRNASKIENCDC
jgi:hypothetical protein